MSRGPWRGGRPEEHGYARIIGGAARGARPRTVVRAPRGPCRHPGRCAAREHALPRGPWSAAPPEEHGFARALPAWTRRQGAKARPTTPEKPDPRGCRHGPPARALVIAAGVRARQTCAPAARPGGPARGVEDTALRRPGGGPSNGRTRHTRRSGAPRPTAKLVPAHTRRPRGAPRLTAKTVPAHTVALAGRPGSRPGRSPRIAGTLLIRPRRTAKRVPAHRDPPAGDGCPTGSRRTPAGAG